MSIEFLYKVPKAFLVFSAKKIATLRPVAAFFATFFAKIPVPGKNALLLPCRLSCHKNAAAQDKVLRHG
ncbi:MAG: hypothetical protein ACI4GB_04145 [Acutalibacteraceae bacterium]